MNTAQDPFYKMSSYIDKIVIPLKKFEYFHKPSSDSVLDPIHVERKKSTHTLKNWLLNNKSTGGSYLITGYRGAGKSSFVGRVLHDIAKEEKGRIKSIFNFQFFSCVFLLLVAPLLIGWIFEPFFNFIPKWSLFVGSPYWVIDIILWICSVMAFYMYSVWWFFEKRNKPGNFHLLSIKINLGHEILHEKDILSLITGELRDKYLEYSNSWKKNCFLKISKLILNILIASFLFMLYLRVTTTVLSVGNKYILYINNVLRGLRFPENVKEGDLGYFWFNIAVFLLFLLLSKTIRIKIGSFIHRQFNIPLTPALNIQQKLEDLEERIDASISVGESSPPFSNKYMQFNFGGKKSKQYKAATEREIEQELIRILALIEENWLYKYRVVIVLDELDKAEPMSEDTEDLLVETLPEYEKSTTINVGGTTTRQRKTNVLSLIANMKFFLSSGKAYFIFIAGRELYEGFLADISDRDFTITSIFNGVINMDSFLITSRALNNIAALSEQYICQHIMPDYEENKRELEENQCSKPEEYYTFKMYYSYYIAPLRKEQKELLNKEKTITSRWRKIKRQILAIRVGDLRKRNSKIKNKKIKDDRLEQLFQEKRIVENELEEVQKIEKMLVEIEDKIQRLEHTVHFLTKFSLYLSYISNGSPKKITSFFEKFVRSHEYLEETDALSRCKPLVKSEYYLVFGFYSQQRINFIYYLTYPVLQAIINRSNIYGDKLLVSATFIVSHIFKLYNSGFSWRNLEQTPELLETNKTPELREYMISIIDFLKRTHISNISCGLYNYKFPFRIAEEIAYHSKLSDENSALFNFSLDETLQVKRFYFRLLRFYTEQGKKDKSEDMYVLANIHHILGDTYMNEENYSKAIFEYHKSASILKTFISSLPEKERILYYYYLVHTQLKQGLANEKRHTDNSAYAIYVYLVDKLKEIKLNFRKKILVEIPVRSGGEAEQPLFTEIRMIYQPLLARLYCLEKIGPEGIRIKDIQNTITDFYALHHTSEAKDFVFDSAVSDNDEDTILKADFFRKLGDITYYKNMGQPSQVKTIIPDGAAGCKHWTRVKEEKPSHYSPCIACHTYKKSLETLLSKVDKNFKGIHNSFAFELFRYIMEDKTRQPFLDSNEELLTQIASGLELRGNTLFSCAHKIDKLSVKFLNIFLRLIDKHRQDKKKQKKEKEEKEFTWIMGKREDRSHLEKVILYYWCAATCFNYAGNLSSAVRCYRQILVVINSFILSHPDEGKGLDITLIRKQLINRALISLYSHYENSNILEIQELKWKYSKDMYENIPLNKLSNIPDVEEFLYPFYVLTLSINGIEDVKIEGVKGIKDLYHSVFMGKYKLPTGLSITVQNLMLKSQINKNLLLRIVKLKKEDFNARSLPEKFYENWLTVCSATKPSEDIIKVYEFLNINPKEVSLYDLVDFLIIDTLFCLTQVLEMVVPLKTTTLFTNYFIAETHEELLHINYMAEFLYFYYAYFQTGESEEQNKEQREKIDKRLIRFMERGGASVRPNWKLGDLYKGGNLHLDDARNSKLRTEIFYDALTKKVKRSNINYTVNVYLAENAIRYYMKAKELHTEGRSYKDTIRNLYFLDDDLYNDTCHFLYARERYFLNCGLIEERLKNLKKLFPHSPLYEINSYFDEVR